MRRRCSASFAIGSGSGPRVQRALPSSPFSTRSLHVIYTFTTGHRIQDGRVYEVWSKGGKQLKKYSRIFRIKHYWLNILLDSPSLHKIASKIVRRTGASNWCLLTPTTWVFTSFAGFALFSANILRNRKFRYLYFQYGLWLVLD